MSENNYGALMMKSTVGVSDDIDSILSPGIYPIPPANTSSPDSAGGVLVVHTGTPIRRVFISDLTIGLTSTRNGNAWTPWKGPLSRTEPFADIKTDGSAAVTKALSNLGFSASDSVGNGWHIGPEGHMHQYGIVTLEAVGTFNPQTIGGATYYTRYYVVALPRAYLTAHQVTTVTIAGRSFDNQGGTYGLWATCNRNTDSSGPSLTSFTVSVTSIDSTQVPIIHFSSEGY